MKKTSKNTPFALSEIQKNISFLHSEGFPFVKSAHPMDWPGEWTNRVYYYFNKNKWQRTTSRELLNLLSAVVEKTTNIGRPLIFKDKKAIRAESQVLLKTILQNHATVLESLDDPFPEKAFIFFSEFTCTLTNNNIYCTAPDYSINNKTSILFSGLTELSFTSFNEQSFYKTPTGRWINSLVNSNGNFLQYIQEVFGACLTPSIIKSRAHLVLDPEMSAAPMLFQIIQTMVGEAAQQPLITFRPNYYFGHVDEMLVNLSRDDRQVTKAAAELSIDIFYPVICGLPKDIWLSTFDRFVAYPISKHFFASRKLPFLVLSDMVSSVFKVLPLNKNSKLIEAPLPTHDEIVADRLNLILWAAKGLQRILTTKTYSECIVVEDETKKYLHSLIQENIDMDVFLVERQQAAQKKKSERLAKQRKLRAEERSKALNNPKH
jgi:hypothetical protein